MADTPTFVYNRDQIIGRTGRIVGAFAAGETPGPQAVQDMSDALNAMVAEWQTIGIHVWKEKEATLFLQPNQYYYTMGGGGVANVCQTKNMLILATANVQLPARVTTIPIAASGNFFNASVVSTQPGDFNLDFDTDFSMPSQQVYPAVGDNFGVMMANNQLFWSTVTAITSTSVTIANPTTQPINGDSVAFDYPQLSASSPSPCAIYRPLRVLNVRRILWSSLIETQVTPYARLDYRNQPNKTQTGIVTQSYYDPQIPMGQFWAWPNPQDSLNGLNFTYMDPIFDFNSAADYPDFPQEWINAIVWNLAEEIKLEYDVAGERSARILERAAQTLDRVTGWDREPESFYLGVNMDNVSR